MPKISIVIPVYNAEKFLVETLDSVKNQTFTDFECVIVNDGSTDNSLEIINNYVAKDNRFRVFTVANNGCANIPRNIAIRNSIGDFIFNLDADDIIDLDVIEKLILRQNETKSDIVLLRMIGCLNQLNGELWRLPLSNFNMKQILTGKDACSLTLGSWQLPCNGMFAKRELFIGVPEGMFFISDEIASRHLLYKAKSVSFAETNYYYRNNNESITRAITPKIFERLLTDELLNNFVREHYESNNDAYIKMRNTRLFNLIYLQYDFSIYKKKFNYKDQKNIENNLKQVYYSQDLNELRKDLPLTLKLLFTNGYSFFKLFSLLYVKYKDKNGRKYQMK